MLLGQPKARSRAIRASKDGGAIYFVQGVVSGHIKIGFSTNVMSRMSSLATGSAEQLRLLGAIPGSHSDEQALHRTFRHFRLKGEWFESAPDLIGYIIGVLATNAPVEISSAPPQIADAI